MKYARKKKGYSLAKLATLITESTGWPRVSISAQALSDIEHGAIPKTDLALKLSELLEVPIASLISFRGDTILEKELRLLSIEELQNAFNHALPFLTEEQKVIIQELLTSLKDEEIK